MITIDIDTISGVPFTGLEKTVRPTTSATTRKLRRKARVAAKASKAFAVRSLQRSSKTLLYFVSHRPLVAELFRLLESDLEHAAPRQPGLVELGGLLLRPALERLRPLHAHRLRELLDVRPDLAQLVELLRIVLQIH